MHVSSRTGLTMSSSIRSRLFAIDRSTLDVKEIHSEDYKLPELSEGFGKVALYFHEYGGCPGDRENLGKSLSTIP